VSSRRSGSSRAAPPRRISSIGCCSRDAMTILYLILGTAFGFVLSRSGAADYGFIQSMFLFQSFQLYGIIGTAVVVTAPGLWLIKRYGRTALGRPIALELKPRHPGNV